MAKLNLGCGNDYREGWVNLDSGDCKADVHCNIEAGLPFPDDYFEIVEAIQVMEHISKENFADVVQEIYRVSKPGAVWVFVVPHGFSDNFITDPTHKMPFSTRTFDYFIDGAQLRENGIIYGWGSVHLSHVDEPTLDGNHSIHFHLKVIKDEY